MSEPKFTPPANFQCGQARMDDPPPMTAEFKASYLRLRMLTELKAIEIAVAAKLPDPQCIAEIEEAINALTDEEIFAIHRELERKL